MLISKTNPLKIIMNASYIEKNANPISSSHYQIANLRIASICNDENKSNFLQTKNFIKTEDKYKGDKT